MPDPSVAYLDNNATTPLDPRVLDAMLPYLRDDFGNAASRHHVYGQRAHEAVERARGQVADLIHADPDEIIFTSGATESNNLALIGAARAYAAGMRRRIITQATEHKSVLDATGYLLSQGLDVKVLPVHSDGRVNVQALTADLNTDTLLVSIMFANNEIGTIQPVQGISTICRETETLFHTDAAQSLGKVPVDVRSMNIDLLSMSAHKLYGPKGIGALFVRRRKPRVKLDPLLHGGGQERGMRSGTLNVPAIVGFGEACYLAQREMADEGDRLGQLRDELWANLQVRIPSIRVNGSLRHRLPGNLSLEIPGVDSEALLHSLEQIAISSGSACTSRSLEPSHVLLSIGLERARALECVRIGLGRFSTQGDTTLALDVLVDAVGTIRTLRGWTQPQVGASTAGYGH